jgi:hypothetical protein
MPLPKLDPVVKENARIIFRNFSGAEGTFNKAGDRNFCVVLSEDEAEQLKNEGWAVKFPKPREDRDTPLPYLPITVKWKKDGTRNPVVVLITNQGKNRTTLGEDELFLLDWAELKNVDLIWRDFNWEVNGNMGHKAYLKSIYVTIQEDRLQLKYADLEDTAVAAIGGREQRQIEAPAGRLPVDPDEIVIEDDGDDVPWN